MKYQIAGINITINTRSEIDFSLLNAFRCDFAGEPHATIIMQSCDRIEFEECEMLLDDHYQWYRSFDGGTIVRFNIPRSKDPIAKIESDSKWERITVAYIQGFPGLASFLVENFLYTVFRILILYHEGILLHSSSFIWKGKGVAITAPSGTGKSTHTALWEKYYQAVILNDDSPAIRKKDGEWVICGIPWSGSNFKFINEEVPLAGLVILEQAAENKIELLHKDEAALRLMPRFILPFYDEKLLDIALNTISEIIAKTPVYLLQCRPDKEAVDLVAAALDQ